MHPPHHVFRVFWMVSTAEPITSTETINSPSIKHHQLTLPFPSPATDWWHVSLWVRHPTSRALSALPQQEARFSLFANPFIAELNVQILPLAWHLPVAKIIQLLSKTSTCVAISPKPAKTLHLNSKGTKQLPLLLLLTLRTANKSIKTEGIGGCLGLGVGDGEWLLWVRAFLFRVRKMLQN